MTETKFTPGPWKVHPVDDCTVVASDGSEVAAIDGDYNQPDTWPIMEANARLIAAAPDLYEALVDIEQMIHNCADAPRNPDSLPMMVLHHARAAIAKATGEAP